MSRSRSAHGRDDGLGVPKHQQQQHHHHHHHHRRANSTPGYSDDFHAGFVKRLAGILDNHGKVIKNNADFLSEISSTLRSHTYSRLPRATSEPALKVPTTPIVQPATPGDSALECSPELMPLTPPDTPTVEISDWSYIPPKPSQVEYQYEQPKVPKIIIKDHSSSTMTTISAPASAIMDLSISSNNDTDTDTVTTASPAVDMRNHQNTSMVPVNRNSVGLSNMASSAFRNMSVVHTIPTMAAADSPSANLVDQNTVSEKDIVQWYTYHADRAAKGLRYDLREIDLKMDRFVRRINDLNSQCAALKDLMSANASAALNPNTQQHRRTRSTPAFQGNDHYTRKEKEIRGDIKEAFDSLRSTLSFYRKHRTAPLELVNAKADVAMPGYWSLDAYGKRRALFHFYNRNKHISRPGDRPRYHDAMALLDACTAMSLNQDFVDKIDRWESQIHAMKSESGSSTVIP